MLLYSSKYLMMPPPLEGMDILLSAIFIVVRPVYFKKLALFALLANDLSEQVFDIKMGLQDIMLIFTGFTKAHKEDKGSFIFLVFGALLISAVSFIEWFFMHKGFTLVSYLGILVALIGFFIRWVGAAILKRQYLHISLIEKRKLVTRSWYSHIRHPCYLGVFISLFGIAMFFSSWAGLFTNLFIIIPIGLRRITKVEKKLAQHYGLAYKNYMKSTKKLIPGVY